MQEGHRRLQCARCGAWVRICAACDRGQRYCAGECARLARRAALRDAAARYQRTARGRRQHAQRQPRYRERRAQKVTHHGSTPPPPPHTLPRTTHERVSAVPPSDPVPPIEALDRVRCDFCAQGCSVRVRIRHPWR